MLKTILLLVTVTLISLSFLITCDTTEPPDNNHPDTTSQNFTFETFEFGDGYSSSYFNDVWIFDENNIWAVGYIDSDSTINANIMRWDGKKWFLDKFSGTSSGIYGIWAHDTSLIYFANGIVLKYSNGEYNYEDFNNVPLPNGQAVHKLWGSSESNIWGVGPWGTIVHYDGKEWKKIEFDNKWHIYNITGNKENGVAYAVAISTEPNYLDVCIIIELKEQQTRILYNSNDRNLTLKSFAIQYYKNKLYLGRTDLVSPKIWQFNLETNQTELMKDLLNIDNTFSILQITMNNENDIFYFGENNNDQGKIFHFNGIRFTKFEAGLKGLNNYGDAYSIQNLIASVGFINNKAFITLIRRN